jgi:D-alanyl-D-alanine dipeptidase
MSLRPWNAVPIAAGAALNAEPLEPLPAALHCLTPHPYASLGAPYGAQGSPFRLRRSVLLRLLQAQAALQRRHPTLRLAIVDGWRPLEVQAFMVEHSIVSTCRERGIDPAQDSPARQAVIAEVGRFWAPPNPDPLAPPPHSTGAAVDLTLADASPAGPVPLAMGSEVDAIGAVSEPDHFGRLTETCSDAEQRRNYQLWHGRRQLLQAVMAEAGFHRHPNEWWHFSWGDQLWAWQAGAASAHYGRVGA